VPVKLGTIVKETDATGRTVFEQVPLEANGPPLKYTFVLTFMGREFTKEYELSTARTSVDLIIDLFTLRVRVVGSAGQPLPYAKVVIRRAGVEIGTFVADESGVVEVPGLLPDNYDIEVNWKGYVGRGIVTADDLVENRIIEISLPPYIEIVGIPLEFRTFTLLIVVMIIAIAAVTILLQKILGRGESESHGWSW